jgi:hypothetical protein
MFVQNNHVELQKGKLKWKPMIVQKLTIYNIVGP